MVVVDSSALIPLARTGRLGLIHKVYKQVHAPEEVYQETVEEVRGKPGTSELEEFFEGVELSELDKERTSSVSDMEGVDKADAAVVLLAEEKNQIVLANDKGLVEFAKIKGIKADWTTTLILRAIKQEVLGREEGKQTLYNLVDKGMNLKNKVYARILKKIEDL